MKFANIIEAWNHDPVKEITNKLSKGEFKIATEQSEFFDFKNANSVGATVSLSDNNLYGSDASCGTSDFGLGNLGCLNSLDSLGSLDSLVGPKRPDNSKGLCDSAGSKCSFSIKHLNKCDNCYLKLKQLINKKVNEKFDNILLENKFKQLQTTFVPPSYDQRSDSWKETLVIMVGAIIAIFLIFMIVKIFYK